MKTTIKEFLKEKLQKALKKLKIQVLDESKLAVTFSNRPELADFQSNIAFVLAKELKTNPMELAGKIKDNLDVDEYFEVSVCAPAFINFKLHSNGVVKLANDIKINSNYGINPIGKGKTVVVDYGGANIAKELHMGHLRAPIIGEAIVRLHKLFGYKTVGDVHLGDWGLQMGLVMAVMGMFSIGGPPVVVYFLQSEDDFDHYFATISAYFVLSGTVSVSTKIAAGFMTGSTWIALAISTVTLMIGAYVGKRTKDRINPAVIRKLVYGVMAISGLMNIITALVRF